MQPWRISAGELADLGRRVDLVEQSIRRGEGDPELAAALQRDAAGECDLWKRGRRTSRKRTLELDGLTEGRSKLR